MKVSDWHERQIARSLVILLLVPFADAGVAQEQASPAIPQQSNSLAQPSETQPGTQPITSDATAAHSSAAYPDAPVGRSNGQTSDSQSGAVPEQSGDVKPLGTAAAPYSKPTGVMGSRPAGAVIAPAKQRRVRAILISVGVVAGAAIAIGTVAALSHGSPSRP